MDHILSGEYGARCDARRLPRRINVVNWNINRGLRLPAVMEFIGNQQPDLCILQEVDLNAKRTGNRNVAEVLASHFRFNYVFGIEFEELSQGTGTEPAFHGQAVFSRWPILEPRVLRFSRQSDFWRPRPYLPRWSILQPRKGGRIALIAELAVGHYRLVIYDLHLESQCDDGLRLWQLNEVVHDSLRYPMGTPVVLAGDLNTRTTPSPLRHYLLASGFQDACERMGCPATKPSGHTLDWIFIRGPAIASDTRVHQEIRASDHFPLSTSLVLTA